MATNYVSYLDIDDTTYTLRDSEAQNSIDSIEKSVSDLENDVSDLNDSIETINDNLDTLKDSMDDLDELTDELEGYATGAFYGGNGYEMYASVTPTETYDRNSGYAAQGFTIFSYSSVMQMANFFINTDEETVILVLTNYSTGARIAEYTYTMTQLGHANSCCYRSNYLYVACGGGDSDTDYVAQISLEDGSITATYDVSAWAIGVYGNYFYYMSSSNTLVEANTSFDTLNSYTIGTNTHLTYQGMCADANYVYLLCGNTIFTTNNYQNAYIAVYTHEGKFKGYWKTYIPIEVEDIAIANNRFNIAANSQAHAIIFWQSGYGTGGTCEFTMRAESCITNTQNSQSIYVNEDSTNAIASGSSSHPLRSITDVPICIRNNTTYLTIYLASDVSTSLSLYIPDIQGVMVRSVSSSSIMTINGNLNIYSGNAAQVYYVNVTGSDGSTTCNIRADYVEINGLTLGEEDTEIVPSGIIYIYAGFANISYFTINFASATAVNAIYLGCDTVMTASVLSGTKPVSGSSFVYRGQLSIDTQTGYYLMNGLFTYNTGYRGMSPIHVPFATTYAMDIDVESICYDVDLFPYSSQTITNLPDSIDTSSGSVIIMISIRVYATSTTSHTSVVTVYMRDGTVQTGWINTAT